MAICVRASSLDFESDLIIKIQGYGVTDNFSEADPKLRV